MKKYLFLLLSLIVFIGSSAQTEVHKYNSIQMCYETDSDIYCTQLEDSVSITVILDTEEDIMYVTIDSSTKVFKVIGSYLQGWGIDEHFVILFSVIREGQTYSVNINRNGTTIRDTGCDSEVMITYRNNE